MTLLSRVLSLFPLLVGVLTVAILISIVTDPSPVKGLALPLVIYGLPLLSYHIHRWIYPVKEGISYLVGPTYSPWWGSYQFQLIYIAFPALEALLRLIPGAFSLWLRLWGSRVGQNVVWTPRFLISDRGCLDIGDNVIFGFDVACYCHVIKPKRNNLLLYLKKIEIGDRVFVGGGSQLGPGAKLPADSYLPILTQVYLNRTYSLQGETHAPPDQDPASTPETRGTSISASPSTS